MVKKLRKQIAPFVATGVVLGLGSVVVGKIGGSTAAASQAGLGAAASFLPVAGAALGGAAVIRSLSFLEPKRKRKARQF